ncbi:MAG TPA: Dna2/Cas4 domain-containing protein [Patescibacteria group bacterium]|nr:Dna2/Cas4 domain-containing protein [Patescibacteria group bacterium]
MGMGLSWLGLALLLIIIAVLSLFWSKRKRVEFGLPSGNIIYTDLGIWVPQQESLYAPKYELVGRPDYLVKNQQGAIVPVEVKSARAPAEPHDGHVMQLAVYCLLVEEVYDIRPDYGILQYQDRAFAVEYSFELEEDLLEVLVCMHVDTYNGELNRSHKDRRRCSRCSMREHCSQRIG